MPSKKNSLSVTNAQPELVPIVAIGASAGGMEAITEVLQKLSPTTGFAFVYIQHLNPEHKSNLDTILSRSTTMPVVQAAQGMRIKANQVYIIPTDQDMAVVDGALELNLRPDRSLIHSPIDQFFISLAERQKDGAIAIILSGTASDGTLGLRAIKAAGGFTFAQDGSAKFQSMPRSAISEGVVDKVLSPEAIARELEQLSRQPEMLRQISTVDVLLEETNADTSTAESIQTIIQILRRVVGVDFTYYKMSTIRRRIIRRMVLYKLNNLNEYAQYLDQHEDEVRLLYNDLLINVTTFFRDTDTMDYLKKVLFPRIINEKPAGASIRIWVPACSTGQEAYSLVMLLLELLNDRSLNLSIQLFATDLSEIAVAKARQGRYTPSELVDVSPKRLDRFFTKIDDHYRINKSVRDLCVFAPHNALKDPPFSRLDFVSCRNLLIYLDTPLQRKAIATFHYALNPTGYLLLGKSETVGSAAALFSQLEKNYKIYARKNDVTSRINFEMNIRQPDERPVESVQVLAMAKESSSPSDLERLVDNLLLQQYVPASVVVNQDLDILHFRGSTGLFLEPAPGKASLNLLKMARPSLAFELRNVVHKARKSNQPVRKSDLEIRLKEKLHYVAIEAVPLRTDAQEQLFLILFEEVIPAPTAGTDSADARNLRIRQLEQELASLREDMRSIIEEQEASNEELQSANEEIISSNEELQSMNEELETSKEEIESTNEELLTINQELQVRNDQLSEAQEFAEVIFSTIREATLVLDEDLRVKSANKAFYKLFKVSEEDTEGRLVYELGGRQWDIPQLRHLLTSVLVKDVQLEAFEFTHTFADIGQKTLLLNARRVVRQTESVLLAIEDITDHRQVQHMLTEREAWLHNLIDNAPVLIWVTNAVGRYTFFNKAWLDFTGRSLDGETNLGWEHDIHPDDRQSYLTTYNAAFAKQQPFQAEFRLKRHDNEYRWMLLNGKPNLRFDESYEGYIGTCAEIYNRTTLLQALDIRARQRMLQVVEANAQVQRSQHELETPKTDEALQQVKEQLQSNQDLLRSLVENTPDAITRWNSDLKLIFANSAFEKKVDLPLSELLNKTNQEMGQPDEIALPYMQKLRMAFLTGQPQSHYNTFPSPNGVAYYYSTMVPELASDGSVKSVLAIARDISDLQLVEDIQQTAMSLQGILNSSPAATGMFKAIRDDHAAVVDFHLLVCNQKFADMTHKPISQLVGQPVRFFASALWGDETFPVLEGVVTSGVSTYREQPIEYDQTLRWFGTSVVKYDDGVVISGLDITLLKQTEQDKEQWLNQLDQSNKTIQALEELHRQLRERGKFLRATSHDLRGNFGVIQGAATLIDMSSTDEERKQMQTVLQRNLKQATQMLTQLLDYSRLEAGQEEVQLSSFDVGDTLCELGESIKPMASEKGLTVVLDGPDHLLVESDSVKIQRIAQNLLLNSVKNTASGSITLSWGAAETAGWEFSVQDTGSGIPAAASQFLTTSGTLPERSDGSFPKPASDRVSGEGIGLIIVKELCKLLNATIEVESLPNQGSRIRIRFPT
ncbi:chemotaxis protein CheB [Spirosoma fluminis]